MAQRGADRDATRHWLAITMVALSAVGIVVAAGLVIGSRPPQADRT
jgi:hypothetical protein